MLRRSPMISRGNSGPAFSRFAQSFIAAQAIFVCGKHGNAASSVDFFACADQAALDRRPLHFSGLTIITTRT